MVSQFQILKCESLLLFYYRSSKSNLHYFLSCVQDMKTGGGKMFCQNSLYMFLICFPSEKTWNENYVIISVNFAHLCHLVITNFFIFIFLKTTTTTTKTLQFLCAFFSCSTKTTLQLDTTWGTKNFKIYTSRYFCSLRCMKQPGQSHKRVQ